MARFEAHLIHQSSDGQLLSWPRIQIITSIGEVNFVVAPSPGYVRLTREFTLAREGMNGVTKGNRIDIFMLTVFDTT
jgi:hypothetical protein